MCRGEVGGRHRAAGICSDYCDEFLTGNKKRMSSLGSVCVGVCVGVRGGGGAYSKRLSRRKGEQE